MNTLKKIFFCCVIIVNILNINIAQFKPPLRPFEKIQYNGLNPVFHTINFDPTIVGDSTDGYNFFLAKPFVNCNDLIKDDYLFTVTYRGGITTGNGTYIQKIHLSTGEVVWQTYFGIGSDDRAEYARLLSFNDEGNLEVISQVYPGPPSRESGPTLYGYMLFSKRIYDQTDGNLLYFEKPDENDKSLLPSLFSLIFSYNVFMKEGNQVRFFESRWDSITKEVFVYSALINPKTKISDNIHKTKTKYNTTYFSHTINKVDDDTYFRIEIKDTTKQVVFRSFDKELNQIKENISNKLNFRFINSISVVDYNSENQTVLCELYLQSQSLFEEDTVHLLVFDLQANLLKSYRVPAIYTWTYNVLEWSDLDNIKLIARQIYYYDDGDCNVALDLLSSDKDSFNVYKSYFPSDPLRTTGSYYKLYETETHVLLQWRERSLFRGQWYCERDIHSSAISYVLVKKEDLGIRTSTYNIEEHKISLYPNPAFNSLTLDFNTTYDGIVEIKNTAGTTFLSHTVENSLISEIDISNVPSGMYIIHFTPSKNNISIKSMKFVKL